MDLGNIEDAVFFEGRTWAIDHDVDGWLYLDAELPEDGAIVFEGRCASLESTLRHRALYTIDPGQSGKVMRALQESKDDARDARTLAELFRLRPKMFKRIQPREPQLQCLRELARTRRTLVQHRTSVLQQLQSVKRRQKGESRSQWLKLLQDTPQASLVAVLVVLDEQIAQLEETLAYEGSNNVCCTTLRTVKGIGKTLSAEIAGEMDGFIHLESKQQAQCYGGTAPVTISSGNRRFVRSRKRCNHRARNALYLFAFCSLRFHAWARDYYDACRQRGKSHNVALIALANRWVPILFDMVKTGQPYDKNRKTITAFQ